MHSSTSFVIAALTAMANGHMNMASPPPINYKGNTFATSIDYSYTSPNTAADFPCKGQLSAVGTDAASSVATWAPGSQQTVTLEGGAAHNGGSCQLSLSYDSGTTWTVIYSKEGDCPTTPTLDFTVPSDTPTGDNVLLGWTWINNTGNREFYMNCASITIAGSSSKREEIEHPNKKRETAFADRPAMFVAQLGTTNFCVAEGVDVEYPEPGPDVDQTGSMLGPAIYCDTQQAIAAGDSGSGSSASGTAATSAAAETSTTAAAATTTAAAATTTAAATTASIPGGVFITTSAASSSAAQQTTLSTKTTKAVASSSSAATKTSSAAPSTGSGGASAGGQTGACTDEGEWFCTADGQSFQRCASGSWSAAMPMAAGTSCTPGLSDSLSMSRRHDRRVRRGYGAWNNM